MLNLLRRIVQEVNSTTDIMVALKLMVSRVKESIEADSCSIFLRDQQTNSFILKATDGLNEESINNLRVRIGYSLVGLVAERAEPLNLADAHQHPSFYEVPELGEEKLKAFLGVPIIHQRNVLGVLFVQQEEERRFDEVEEAFLITLSAQLAGVIAHAQLSGVMNRIKRRGLTTQREEATIMGVSGADGVGIGQAVVVYPLADLDAVPERAAENLDQEIANFQQAIEAARKEIRHLSERLAPTLPVAEQALFDVYLKILDNASLGDEVITVIKEQRVWAQSALCQVINRHLKQFESMDDSYFKERADDIEDLGKRVLSHLQSKEFAKPDYPAQTILIGEEVSAADLADVPENKLVGVVSGRGSANSHVAILARALGVPTVMGAERVAASQLDGQKIIVDGYYGQVYISPSATLLNEFTALLAEEKELEADLEEMRDLPAQTTDGHGVNLSVNTGLVADISRSLSVGAQGVGLYRTEIPFMVRERFPTEKEQTVIYQQLLAAFAPRPVIMRTLDVGGDKCLPYLPIEEDNPFLGWRGIRITLDHPEIFLVQLRAMLRAASVYDNLRILLPMITSVSEVNESLRLLNQALIEVQSEGLEVEMPPVGVMIEVPSAVYQAQLLAQRVDFLSIGTNDLTQYILAVDRNNPRVANLYDSLHPAVLRAMLHVVECSHKEGKMVSVCGEMAGDPAAIILLLAMGFDSFSMNSSVLPRIKWVIRKLSIERAREVLEEVLSMDDPGIIRSHLERVLDEFGLGGLIRAGKK